MVTAVLPALLWPFPQVDRLPDAIYGATSDGDDIAQARGGPAGSLTIVYLDNGTIVWTGDVRCFADHGEQQFRAAWQWLQALHLASRIGTRVHNRQR